MKCERCGREMEYVERDDDAYYVCHDCKVRRHITDRHIPTPTHKKKNKFSVCLLISFLIGLAYCIYSIVYWSGALDSLTGTAEQIGAGLATVMVMPHLICTFLATLFNGVGCFARIRGLALTGAILYTIALVLFFPYFMFVILEVILSFVGFATMKQK